MQLSMILTGLSGQTYEFSCYQPHTIWNEVPGCYVFAARQLGSGLRIFYIGETDSFQRRMSEHQDDVWAFAVQRGANLILARPVPNEALRKAMEVDLIRAYQPPLNTQHVQPVAPAQRPQPPHNPLLDLVRQEFERG
jgi:hypothetical protein